MTFTAVLCVLLVYVFVKYLNELWPNGIPSLVKIPLALAGGVGVVLLVAHSDFAVDQEFMGRTLDTLNGASQVIAGLLVGAAAVGADTAFKTIRNVGENDDVVNPGPGNE